MFKKIFGIILIIVGFLGIITPFTPWGILFFIGLELVGIRLAFFNKIRDWWQKRKNIDGLQK